VLEIIGAALAVALKLLTVFTKTPEAKAEHARLTSKLLKDIEDFSRILDNPTRKPGDTSEIENFFRRR
jgi:hypothetical protein